MILASAVTAAHGDCFQLLLQPTSTLDAAVTTSTPITGTFKGNYDATTNPAGTKTIPGLFGGSGNNPIPYSGMLNSDAVVDSVPQGSGRLLGSGEVLLLSGLELDLLGGAPAPLDAEMVMTYSDFHTQQPSSIYPGASNVPIPVSSGTLDSLLAVQVSDAPLLLVPQGDGQWTFSTVVPVILSGSATVNGQVVPLDPAPGELPLSGTLTIQGGVATLVGDGQISQTQTIPSTGQGFTDQPIDIPTILPAGSVAHLLVSGMPGATTATVSSSLHLVAAGPAAPVGDLDCDGVVSGPDLAAMLALWGHVGSAGDLDGDGVVGGGDLSLLLANWSA